MIQKEMWIKMFSMAADVMKQNKDYLSEIDSKFGDGDHGITIERIANLIDKSCIQWETSDESLKNFLSELGSAIINVNGGSAGPLYGTFVEGLSEGVEDGQEVDEVVFKNIMRSGLSELQDLTTAKVGDKTMMDTLIPAIEAIDATQGDLSQIIKAGKDAAVAGAEKSKEFISKYGRARSYKEATIGTPDAGAVSCSYIFIGFDQAYNG